MPRPRSYSAAVALLAVGCGSDSGRRDLGAGRDFGWGALPTPAHVGPGVRVFSGTSSMLFDGAACSAESGAKDDRWCAFITLGSDDSLNLFALNVTEVVAGTAVSCDTPDPNCLLLTASFGGDGFDPTWHGTFFQGDTLVYYDDELTPWVWRPGYERGRLLAYPTPGLDVIFCLPAPRGTAVACMGLPDEQPDPTVAAAELYLGRADAESEPLLAPIDRVIAANLADAGGVARFSYGFPASQRDSFVWSSREAPDGPEVLKVQAIDDPESQLRVASDVHAWDVSSDGARWFWLGAIDANGAGVLQTAAFPDGAEPTDVLESVLEYAVDRSDAVVARTDRAALFTVADPVRSPEAVLTIDSGVQALVRLSEQGHIAYAKHFVGTSVVDLFVTELDGANPCVIDTSVSVPLRSIHFAPGAESTLWARARPGGVADGQHTRLSDCRSIPFAPGIVASSWLGKSTIVFLDALDTESGTATLRYQAVDRDGSLTAGPPGTLSKHVDTYAIAPNALVYTVNESVEADGVYVRAF